MSSAIGRSQVSSIAIGIVAVAGVALLRAWVQGASGAPVGIDGGNWLAFGSFERTGTAYPPLVPALFTAAVSLFGPTSATVELGALATALPGMAVLGIAAWAGQPTVGALAAVAVTASGAIGEAAAWGGYPQPMATATAVCAVVALTAFLDDGGRGRFAIFAVAVALTVATSHLVTVPLFGAIGLVVVWSLGVHRRRPLRRAVATVAFAALPVVVLGSTYVTLFSTLVGVPLDPPPADADRILGDGWMVYLGLAALVPATALGALLSGRAASVDPRAHTVSVATSALILAWGAAFLVSGERRLIHDLAVLAPLGAVALAPWLGVGVPGRRLPRTIAAAAVVAVALSSSSGLRAFPDQVAFYQVLTPDSLVAVEWLAAQPGLSDGGVLVADVHGAPMGWWVEGITRHEARFGSDLRWLRFPAERDRARQANGVLYAPGAPDAASASLALGLGVQYLLLPSASAFGVTPDEPPAGWSVEFDVGPTVVLRPIGQAAVP